MHWEPSTNEQVRFTPQKVWRTMRSGVLPALNASDTRLESGLLDPVSGYPNPKP